jgi:rod shape-determining protein MreC
MTSGRSQHRSLLLLAASLGVQILLLAAQVKRDQDVRLIRVWAVEIVAPLGRSTNWLVDGVGGIWTNYVDVRSLGRENKELHAEVDQLKLRNSELEGRAAEADRLATLLDFRKRTDETPMLAARVIGASPSSSGRVAFLDRGSRDGVAMDMGVITPQGVVGKVIAVYPATSQVLLVSDKDSGVGALLTDTRTQSPVRGSGDPLLDMEYVAKEVKVRVGEAVVTSGQDRIFPKDLPVGIVQTTDPDPHSPFQKIVIKPAARLDQLEEVLVLLTRRDLAPGAMTNEDRPEGAPSAAAPKGPVTPTSPAARPVTPTAVSAPAPAKPPTPAPAAATAPVKPRPTVPAAPPPVTSPQTREAAPESLSEPVPAADEPRPAPAPEAQEPAREPAGGGER